MAARKKQQADRPPPPKSMSAAVKEIAALQATIETLTADNVAMRAAADQRVVNPIAADQSVEWRPLKSIDASPFSYETIRRWCEAKIIIAEKRGGRWWVMGASLVKRLQELKV